MISLLCVRVELEDDKPIAVLKDCDTNFKFRVKSAKQLEVGCKYTVQLVALSGPTVAPITLDYMELVA